MPNRFVEKNGRTVEMLTRVPVNRGSLLKSIDNLLKTIETSENAVMIPTLLKDKVRVDACELLFVAKILKASILGHSDLVEFYMNHIGQTSSALQQLNEAPSPAIRLQPQSPMASPLLTHAISNHQREQQQQQALSAANSTNNTTTNGSQGASSLSSMSTCSTASSCLSLSQAATPTANGARSSNGSASWISAQQSLTGNTSENSLCSAISASSSETATSSSCADQQKQQQQRQLATPAPTNLNPSPNLLAPEEPGAHEALLATANKPILVRQAQPPSLLQLTTINNHINSMSDMFQGAQQLSPSLEQLTGQLAALQQQTSVLSGAQHPALASNPTASGTLEGLSISTTAANGALQLDQLASTASTPAANGNGAGGATPPAARHELRSSRSAGCLFRANSGATSPRTPNQTTPSTPFPQAETLDGAGASNGLVGEPGSLVKLLLQVEQLKSSIAHCTTLLESVVELYKNSIDNLA